MDESTIAAILIGHTIRQNEYDAATSTVLLDPTNESDCDWYFDK